MKPYYEDGSVQIYHAQAEWFPLVGVGECLITDPPYGFGSYPTDEKPDASFLASLVEAHEAAAIFGYPEQLVALCVERHLVPDEWVTWWPTNTVGGARRSRLLPRECEHIAIFGEVVGGRELFRPRSQDAMTRTVALSRGHDVDVARLGDVWRDASPGAGFNSHLRQHPNEKPLSLMVKLVTLCSSVGQTVFDPFCGSGTTLVAAKQLQRKAIGIEVEEAFCEVAATRCAQEVLAVA